MVKKRQKRLQSYDSATRKILEKIIGDILSDKLTGYDLKILSGAVPHLYRIRKGKYRVIFTKIAGNIDVIAVDTRGDIYKSL